MCVVAAIEAPEIAEHCLMTCTEEVKSLQDYMTSMIMTDLSAQMLIHHG